MMFVAPCSWGKLFKKEVINDIYFLDEAYEIENLIFFLNVLKNIKGMSFLKVVKWHYVVRDDSLISNVRIDKAYSLMDNLITLRKKGYLVDIGVVEVRDKDNKKQTEIDFVCNFGSKKYYIQSALSVSDESKKEQELRPLLNVNDFFKKIIITKDGVDVYRNEDGVIFMNIYEFLLNENSLDL